MNKITQHPQLFLYIIGLGRSGSTVLNAYLSRYPGTVALGEIAGEIPRQKFRPIIGDLLNFKRWAQQRRRFAQFLHGIDIPYTTLSYKDFCAAPDRVSEALMSEFGLVSFSDWNSASLSTHIIGGSRVRHDASRLNTISLDTNWKQDTFLRFIRPLTFFLCPCFR